MPAQEAQSKAKEREERFERLRARAQTSAKDNLKEAALETHRSKAEPITALQRKRDIASHNLLKDDIEAKGEDFERKRAWDWTIEESEKWDRRLEKKARHRDDEAFQDYTQDARKIYKRNLKEMKPDKDSYAQQKAEALERAAASGGLEIVESGDGELVAVDKAGIFYSTADSTEFIHNRPDKASIDRLVKNLQKAEDQRLKKRKERLGKDEDEDITSINEKNRQFNLKLARFYNKYTTDIRDSFERGTMI